MAKILFYINRRNCPFTNLGTFPFIYRFSRGISTCTWCILSRACQRDAVLCSWVLVGLLLEHLGLTWDVNSSEGYDRLHGVHVAQHREEHCRRNCKGQFPTHLHSSAHSKRAGDESAHALSGLMEN